MDQLFSADELNQGVALGRQQVKNEQLLKSAHCLGGEITSEILPFSLDLARDEELRDEQGDMLNGLSIRAARTAVKSLASLAEIGEMDHLGGGMELIPALTLTLAACDHQCIVFTIEHAHTSIGYYSVLAAYGFLEERTVIEEFRRGLNAPGHVAWVPGGTPLAGGRLGLVVPAAVGWSLGLKAKSAGQALVICHCGDAGWISGQALNGFNGASLHQAPALFIMHRNGIQLSGPTAEIMPKDPRPIIEAMGVTILEVKSLHDWRELFAAYRQGWSLTREGKPCLIYPTGLHPETDGERATLAAFGERHGIAGETANFAKQHGVSVDSPVWIPGSLMSFRDVEPMLECLFLVNRLPGGAGHHDGHMKGREAAKVLANPMLQVSAAEEQALDALGAQPRKTIVTKAHPAPGSPNLALSPAAVADVELPPAGKPISPRAGSEAAYAAIAKAHPERMFVVSCDLDSSTKLAAARKFLPPDHQFEMSIEEQAAALMANGLALVDDGPQLNVFSTFAAFFEGIAREGFEFWRYQRNLTGVNEGLNVCMHLSHVGACTGRDHFSGWSLDWITLALGYLPYLHRFYAPADARAAFLAVKDLAAHYGGHIIGLPRDKLPILEKQDGSGPLWEKDDAWEAATVLRRQPQAGKAILALGAPAFLAAEASNALAEEGVPVDAIVINGLPLPPGALASLFAQYPAGIVTVEDGLIGVPETGLRGFAGLIAAATKGRTSVAHVGIVDPTIAPSAGHHGLWEHFGITCEALIEAVQGL